MQPAAHTLFFTFNPNNPQNVMNTINSDSTQHITATIQINLPNI